MTLFKPCIDLHEGQVKQIVGGSLSDSGVTTNFASAESPAHYATMYQSDGLLGGHVIKLGPGNDEAAKEALAAWPNGLQLGGGITIDNASEWLDAGASHVIVTSWLFDGSKLSMDRVKALADAIGRHRLVIDLSCRRVGKGWHVATDRWQTVTDTAVTAETMGDLAQYCAEFLIHAADVEGLCQGIDEELVTLLGTASPIPCTYAGGGRSLDDLARVSDLSSGLVDLTIGSALDIFGGNGVTYEACVAWNQGRRTQSISKSQR